MIWASLLVAAVTLSRVHLIEETPTGIASSQLAATFGSRGLTSVTLLATSVNVVVDGDEFAFGLNGSLISSASLPVPTKRVDAEGNPTYRYTSGDLSVDVKYTIVGAFVYKQIAITSRALVYNVTNITLFANSKLRSGDIAPTGSTVARSPTGLKDYALFLRWPSMGALLTARNPYLSAWLSADGAASVSYAPMMPLTPSTAFEADTAHLGLHELAAQETTARAAALNVSPPPAPIDAVEHAAMQACVRQAIAAPQRQTAVKINVAWCENDYQIDISTERGRAEYKRIIDKASELGIEHLLFAPRNSDVSSLRNGTDAWGWEQILWFGMGERLRMGLWKPGDELPASLRELLAHFRQRGVRPVAYVYPILAFLAGTLPGGGSPPWIVEGTYASQERLAQRLVHLPTQWRSQRSTQQSAQRLGGIARSNLASPALQRWLPQTMLAFANQTGAGGFSFDYTYFEQGAPGGSPWESQYAQWAGWRTILSQLQVAGSCAGRQCVVDNRQANHAWGPWMWAQGGTYAEPLQSDEQPGSWMFYEADLKTDRLSANRQRETAWSYRMEHFAPAELVPGFALHQTDRDPSARQRNVSAGPGCPQGGSSGRCAEASRRRDFDLLGYRYSLLAAVGTGGANLVLNMLPARDEGEFAGFPQEDVAFFQKWLSWADEHRELIANTRVLPNASRPGAGSLDGVSLLRSDGSCTGALFVFNPTATSRPLSVTLDASLGCAPPASHTAASATHVARQAGSSDRSEPLDGWARQLLRLGDTLTLSVPPTTALVIELRQWEISSLQRPFVLGAALSSATLASNGTLSLHGVVGEQGTEAQMRVLLPPRVSSVTTVMLNGKRVHFEAVTSLQAAPQHMTISIQGTWAGDPFGRAQEIGTATNFSGGEWSGSFIVPEAALLQLAARNKSYPLNYDLDPESNNEANVPWLAPGRLLVWAKYAPLLDDTFNVTGAIDGQPILVRKAYNTIVPSGSRFIGNWADVTHLVRPGRRQTLTLHLPPMSNWAAHPGYLAAGNDIELASGSVAAAREKCASLPHCVGLTFHLESGAQCSDTDITHTAATAEKIYLKASTAGGRASGNDAWCSLLKPPQLQGVHFENVETLSSSDAELLQ